MSKYTRCPSYAYSSHAPFLCLPPPLFFLAQPLRDTPILTPISCSSNSQPVHLQKKNNPPPPKKKTLAHTCTQHLCLCLHICLLPSLTTSCYYRCLHSVTLNIRNMQQESKFSTSMHSAGCTVVSVTRVRLSTQCCRTINRSLLEISSVPSSVTLCREP